MLPAPRSSSCRSDLEILQRCELTARRAGRRRHEPIRAEDSVRVETLRTGRLDGRARRRHDAEQDDDVLTYETLTLRASSDDDAERWLCLRRVSLERASTSRLRARRSARFRAPGCWSSMRAIPRRRCQNSPSDARALRRQAMYPEPSTGILQQLVRIADSSILRRVRRCFVNHAVN